MSPVRVIQFTAPWCGPCRPVERILDELRPSYPQVEFVRVDVDAEPETGARYLVLALPTVVVERDGERVATIDGARPRRVYEQALREVVPPGQVDRAAAEQRPDA
jgi:thioredoxin 1